jgi:hypothetical protein
VLLAPRGRAAAPCVRVEGGPEEERAPAHRISSSNIISSRLEEQKAAWLPAYRSVFLLRRVLRPLLQAAALRYHCRSVPMQYLL